MLHLQSTAVKHPFMKVAYQLRNIVLLNATSSTSIYQPAVHAFCSPQLTISGKTTRFTALVQGILPWFTLLQTAVPFSFQFKQGLGRHAYQLFGYTYIPCLNRHLIRQHTKALSP